MVQYLGKIVRLLLIVDHCIDSFSWGVRCCTPHGSRDEETPVISEELKIDEVTNEELSVRESANKEQPLMELELTKMDFVESKLLSHERVKEAIQHRTLPARGQKDTCLILILIH